MGNFRLVSGVGENIDIKSVQLCNHEAFTKGSATDDFIHQERFLVEFCWAREPTLGEREREREREGVSESECVSRCSRCAASRPIRAP